MNSSEVKTHFKGWAIPGPRVPGPELAEFAETPADQTLDALSGHFKIYQYKDGHRFSTDDLLVAWYGTSFAPAAARVLDLGSGIGSVGMVAAWRLPGAQFVTVEAQTISVALARKSARYNGLESRYEIRQGDFRDKGVLDADETFDLVLGSPPYFPLDAGKHGDHEQKIACRFEVRGDIADYCRVAAQHLALGGMFACVFPVNPPHQRERVLSAIREGGLVLVRSRDVVLKEGEEPLLGLFLCARATDQPAGFTGFVEQPLLIRMRTGEVSREYGVVKLSIGFRA